MITNHSKNKILPLVTVVIIFTFLFVLNIKINQKRNALEDEISRLNREINELSQKKVKLLNEISKSETDDFLERTGREELNLKAEGEKVVAFPIIEKDDFFQTTTKEKVVEKDSFWSKLLKLLRLK